jgi:hypothetical protein
VIRALPVPVFPGQLTTIDPFRHREPFVKLLSAIWHAEKAALDGFSLLQDPQFVRKSELFAKASRRLVQDEAKHLDDIAHIVELLDPGGGVRPPSAAAKKFWSEWRSGQLFVLPFKPSIAALFCLFSEGLGFAVLHNLVAICGDSEIREILEANVEDEKMHLQLSMTVLCNVLRSDPRGFQADFVVYAFGYGMLVKDAMREYRGYLTALGLDYDAFTACSIRFVTELLLTVVDEVGPRSLMWSAVDRATRSLWKYPAAVHLLYASSYLPAPPLAARLVHAWGAVDDRRSRREEARAS